MKPSQALIKHREALRALSLRHTVVNPRVFGSVVHGDDTEASDLDLLVDHTSDTTLFNLAALQTEAERLLGVRVDVRTPLDLPPRVRMRVLQEATPI